MIKNDDREEVIIPPLEVKVYDNHFEDAFRRFKSLVQKEKVVAQFKQRQSYEKPSEKKRRKRKEAAERRMIAESRERQIASGEWDRKQKKKEEKRLQKMELAYQKRMRNEQE